MDKHFVYVFSKADADELMRRGFSLLSHNASDNCYILTFGQSKADFTLDEIGINGIESDTLRL